MDDHELLREFVRSRSEDAFNRLVQQHLPMVFSAARRMTGDEHLAQDVAQTVFTTFAEKARAIKPPQVVGGWLYNTTRHLAMHAVRSEQRRREREQTAVAMQTHASSDTHRLMDQLEPAMAELDADDRDTLVLRYLEDRNLREVGAEFGISEDAARMRANRALERLRTVLGRNGVTVTSVVLGSALASTTSSAVPTGLAGAITTTALAGTVLTTATITTITWMNAKALAAITAAAIVAGTGTYLVKQNEVNRLRAENQNLTAQQATATAEHEAALRAAQIDKDELARLKKESTELPRLRNEVSQLRRETAATKARTATPPAESKPDTTPKGPSITRQNLAYAGYATPEAALQTVTWAAISPATTPAQLTAGLAPSLLNDEQAFKEFEENRKPTQQVFKSLEMLAKKTLDADTVEVKVALKIDLGPNMPEKPADIVVLPMTRIDNSWKLAGNPREYKETWDKNGLVQTYPK